MIDNKCFYSFFEKPFDLNNVNHTTFQVFTLFKNDKKSPIKRPIFGIKLNFLTKFNVKLRNM